MIPRRGVSISPPLIVGKRQDTYSPSLFNWTSFSCCPESAEGSGRSLSPFLSTLNYLVPFQNSVGKLGWPWRWPLFVDLILASSKHFPSPISSFFSFTNDVAAERWRRSKRFFDNTILFSLTLALSFLFFCRKQDWHGSGSRKRRAGRPSWAKRRRPRHVWPRRRAAFSWTTITRRRISSSCSIIICFVVWRRPR